MPTTCYELTKTERKSLKDYERTIENGLETFFEVGRALMSIRQEQLFLATHTTFDDYLRDRWGMEKSYASRCISASSVRERIVAAGCSVLPDAESQVRPLTRLPEERQVEAWNKAVLNAACGRVTAEIVANVVGGKTKTTSTAAKKKPSPRTVLSTIKQAKWTPAALLELEELVKQLKEAG